MAEIKISDLTSANAPSGGEVFAVVQNNTTHKTTIDSLKPALVDNLSTGAPTWGTDGVLRVGRHLIAGYVNSGANEQAGGTIGLTLNDGYGNANLTFNHTNGVPDRSGSSARIAVSVDSNQELMDFQLKGSVEAGSAAPLATVLRLQDDNIQLLKKTTLSANGTLATSLVNKGYIDGLLANKANTNHTHSGYALTNHTHSEYALTDHTHTIGNITNLQTSLDSKIGESEINTAHFTFSGDALQLNTIQRNQIANSAINADKIENSAVTPSKLSTGAPAWGANGDLTTGGIFTTGEGVEIHYWGTGDRYAYVDFHAAGDAGLDYDARLIREPGVNGTFKLINNGTGPITVDRTIAQINTAAKSIATKEYVDAQRSANGFKTFGTPKEGQFSTFYRHTFYISQANKLMTAGHGNNYNMNGESDEYITGYTAPMIPLAKGEYVVDYYTGGNTAPSIFVLTNFKNLYASGYNGYGQLGLGDATSRQIFTKVPISNVEHFSVSVGGDNGVFCGAVDSTGSLWMWGHNASGQLGLGDRTQRNTPTRNTSTGPGAIIAKKVFTFCHYGCAFYIDSNRNIRSTGYNGLGHLGLGNTTERTAWVQINGIRGDYVKANAWNQYKSTYIVDGNNLYSCGYNNEGQLGLGDRTDRNTFNLVPGVSVGSIVIPYYGVLVLQPNGTLRCWGHNNHGQLGVGNTTDQNTPQTPSGNHTGVVAITSSAQSASCWILKSDGTIFSTGYNGHGQLGHGATAQITTYKKVQMDNNLEFKSIAGFGHGTGNQLLAADQNDNLWGCGYNAQWSLGLNYSHTYKTVLTQLHIPS